jgi:Glycine zipper 2TM domain
MVQKLLVVMFASLLLGSSAMAQEGPSTEQVLGAIAGGALGSTIGDGDGKKAATVIGAIIGYRMGEHVLHKNEHREFMRLDENDFRRWCRNEVPHRYERRDNLRRQWIAGCVVRLQRQQRELERQAYEDGLYGPTN